jgi:hypothetical protein
MLTDYVRRLLDRIRKALGDWYMRGALHGAAA